MTSRSTSWWLIIFTVLLMGTAANAKTARKHHRTGERRLASTHKASKSHAKGVKSGKHHKKTHKY